MFFINAVIASYNIGGTIEGMHDPKFKRIGRGALLKRRSSTERSCGVSGRENAGMSSEREVGIFSAEYPRFPG